MERLSDAGSIPARSTWIRRDEYLFKVVVTFNKFTLFIYTKKAVDKNDCFFCIPIFVMLFRCLNDIYLFLIRFMEHAQLSI